MLPNPSIEMTASVSSAAGVLLESPAAARQPDLHERVRLMRDGFINYSAVVVNGIIGMLLVPILLRGLGFELYGIWIAAYGFAGIVGLLEFGFGYAITREVAAIAESADAPLPPFVRAAASAYLLIGFAGCVVITALGVPLAWGLHLSPPQRVLAHEVFLLVGLGFAAEQVMIYSIGVLNGVRRFDCSNTITVASSLVRAAGVVLALLAGGRLLALTAWYTAASWMAAVAAMALVGHVAPRFRFRPARPRWRLLASRVPFGVGSLLTSAVQNLSWQVPPIAIGLLRGPAAIVPYFVGQRLPLAVSGINVASAEALFPAASAARDDSARSAEILEVGTRGLLLVSLPLSLALFILAPNILQAWLGHVPADAVLVLRLAAVAALLEAVGSAGAHLLWGRGTVGSVVTLTAPILVVSLGGGLLLLGPLGLAGPAIGLLFNTAAASLLLLSAAAHACASRPTLVLAKSVRGLALPALAATLVLALLARFVRPVSAPAVIGSAALAALVYLVILYKTGARPEEQLAVEKLFSAVRSPYWPSHRALRGRLRRIGWLRSAWYFPAAALEWLRDGSAPALRAVADDYRHPDPWRRRTPAGQERLRQALQLLAHTGQTRFRRMVEIGSGDGEFSQYVAAQCDSFLGLELYNLAVARARQRLAGLPHVEFRAWDLRRDPLPGKADLIAAISALEYLHRPSAVRAVRDKLVDALVPGGYLLVDVTRYEFCEQTWWARRWLRGKYINAFIGRHPELDTVAAVELEGSVCSLFRKKRAGPDPGAGVC